MPAPTTYSESIFADYLTSILGPVANVLGWDSGSAQVVEAVNDAVLDIGVTAGIASVTDIRGLRALGRRAIWRAVVQATAGFYSITDNGQKLERQQINAQAGKMLTAADDDCRVLGVSGVSADPAYAVSIVRVIHANDPYAVIPDAERIP